MRESLYGDRVPESAAHVTSRAWYSRKGMVIQMIYYFIFLNVKWFCAWILNCVSQDAMIFSYKYSDKVQKGYLKLWKWHLKWDQEREILATQLTAPDTVWAESPMIPTAITMDTIFPILWIRTLRLKDDNKWYIKSMPTN